MGRPIAARIFRVLLTARDFEKSRRFYASLLHTPGRLVAKGRAYFDCGRVILAVVDGSSQPRSDSSQGAGAIYLATDQLERMHRTARRLGCTADGLLHDDPESPLGEIVVRPWGERSFYIEDPAGNSLCFVDDRTLFRGAGVRRPPVRKGSRRRRRSGRAAPDPD